MDIRRLGRGQTSPPRTHESWKLHEFQDRIFTRPEPGPSPETNKNKTNTLG